jgi:outer membrane biosynthesis protein TonB
MREAAAISGVLNMKVISEVLPPYPQRAKDKRIEGRVEVQLLVNEDGEVIFTNHYPVQKNCGLNL